MMTYAPTAGPEMASLGIRPMNFGILPRLERFSEWMFDREPGFLANAKDFLFPSTFAAMECARRHQGRGRDKKCEFKCQISITSATSGISSKGT